MISDDDRQVLYNAVSERLMRSRVEISKLEQNSLTKGEVLRRVEAILSKAQDETAQLAVSTAATLRSVKNHDVEVSRLRKALEKYVSCRHGSEECNCTTEARAVLYPYLRRQSEVCK